MKTQLKKDEKIILVIRQHWFTLVVPILIALAFILAGILIHGYGLLLIVLAAGYLFYKWIARKNNIWVVTNLRVVDEFGVFSNNSKESPLDKINNVSYKQSFWGKIFGYGNVQIQTAAEVGETTYLFVEKPDKLKDAITQMHEEYKETQIRKQASELASAIAARPAGGSADVPGELERLFDLKQKGIITEDEFMARKTKLLNS